MNSEQLAWRIRRHGVEMTHLSGGSHIGSVLSVADILAVLYADVLKYDPKNPKWEERDRMILSKGHAGAAIYAALAECGFFPLEELRSHYQNGSRLSGHVSHYLPGVEVSTGSLGHGLSMGAGMAYSIKKDGKDPKVYVVMGDGECEEGQIWEAAMFCSHQKIDNLIGIIDWNMQQIDGTVDNVAGLGDLDAKWRIFGWEVISCDGHDFGSILSAYAEAKSRTGKGKPVIILMHSDMGHGVDFMAGTNEWHGKAPSAELAEKALSQLEETLGDY